MGAGLVFDGDIDLLDSPGGDFWFELLASADFGNPQPVEVTLTSLLRDGTIVATQKVDNREAVLPIRVHGTDSLSLNEGEARLALACGKQTTLVYTPSDGIAPSTVFKVLTSSLEAPSDDMAELHNRRTYRLRLVCEPYTRSVDKIIDSAGAPPSAGSGTSLDACDSATGWSSQGAGIAPALDTSIHSQGTGSVRTESDPARYIQTFTTSGTKYSLGAGVDSHTGLSYAVSAGDWVSVTVRMEWPTSTMLAAEGLVSEVYSLRYFTSGGPPNGTAASGVMKSDVDANGFVRYVWQAPATATITRLDFYWSQAKPDWGSASFPHVWYDDIRKSPTASTDPQILKSFTVKGSARSTGALHIAAPSDAVGLGNVLAVTVPRSEVADGFQIDMRRWVTSGSATTDSTALHGSYLTAGSCQFDVPVTMLNAGPHQIVALVNTSSSTPLTVNAQLLVGSTLTGPVSTKTVTVGAPYAAWQLVTIGTVYLPPLPMTNADSTVKVRITFAGSSMPLADAFMIPATADFTIVACGTGLASITGASSHLWLDSPSPDQPRGGVWRGPVAARGNSRSAWPDVKKPGTHTFTPGEMLGWVVATGAQGPSLTPEYFPCWFGNAAL